MLGHAAAALERIANAAQTLLGRSRNRVEPCRGPAELAALLADEAAFVGQKTVVEFCRLRAGCCWATLFDAPDFKREMDRSRWRSFAILLGDLAEMAQILLRRAGAEPLAGPDRLAGVVRTAVRHHGSPPALGDPDQLAQEIEARLARQLLAAPRPVHMLGHRSGKLVFEALPITGGLGPLDLQHVTNAIRFGLCGAYARLEERVDVPALVRALPPEPRPAAP